jgi:hypothetical protein
VADVLATTFFCYFRVQTELYHTQGENFKSQPLQEVLQCFRVWVHPPPLCIQLNGMVESYVTTVDENVKIISTNQRAWDERDEHHNIFKNRIIP